MESTCTRCRQRNGWDRDIQHILRYLTQLIDRTNVFSIFQIEIYVHHAMCSDPASVIMSTRTSRQVETDILVLTTFQPRRSRLKLLRPPTPIQPRESASDVLSRSVSLPHWRYGLLSCPYHDYKLLRSQSIDLAIFHIQGHSHTFDLITTASKDVFLVQKTNERKLISALIFHLPAQLSNMLARWPRAQTLRAHLDFG